MWVDPIQKKKNSYKAFNRKKYATVYFVISLLIDQKTKKGATSPTGLQQVIEHKV